MAIVMLGGVMIDYSGCCRGESPDGDGQPPTHETTEEDDDSAGDDDSAE